MIAHILYLWGILARNRKCGRLEVIEKSLIKDIIYKDMSRIRKSQQKLGLHREEKKRGRYCPS